MGRVKVVIKDLNPKDNSKANLGYNNKDFFQPDNSQTLGDNFNDINSTQCSLILNRIEIYCILLLPTLKLTYNQSNDIDKCIIAFY